MAERVLTPCGLTPAYVDYRHYPWGKLEEAAGKSFDDGQRRDIFDVWEWFELSRAQVDEMPTVASVEELRRELRQLCSQMHRADGTVDGDETRERLFDALCWYLGDGPRAAINAAREAAFEALCQLSREPAPGAVIQDVRGARAFTLRQVVELIRRPVYDGGPMRGETWGLTPGGRSPSFRRFLATLMERSEPEVTEDELRNAIRELERRRKDAEGDQ